ncbi:hypothetical protein [Okeania sp. SIO2B3]|uniref:hypothetical protein n=1 Tax=Okeania sp. SIO2B3 TaxID=2607784 RepID=UPI0013C1D131|nr:hypothetical protein [Okeania sp. SIO2B3]NET42120.1 hypothetical protein [Okeania sp. SIO2B3]
MDLITTIKADLCDYRLYKYEEKLQSLSNRFVFIAEATEKTLDEGENMSPNRNWMKLIAIIQP